MGHWAVWRDFPEHDNVLKMIAKFFAKSQHGEVRVANLEMHRLSSAFEQPSFRLRDNQPSQSLSANFWLYPYGVNPALVSVERYRGTCNHVTGLLSNENRAHRRLQARDAATRGRRFSERINFLPPPRDLRDVL